VRRFPRVRPVSWAKLSTILEPENLTRRIYGFDTFEGFPSVSPRDQSEFQQSREGELKANSFDELNELIQEYDADRFLGHMHKVELVKGDLLRTTPEFIETHRVIAFDELDNPIWPGETLALLETLGIGALRLRRLEWDPYIGYAVIE
jgi:hypothetical protein